MLLIKLPKKDKLKERRGLRKLINKIFTKFNGKVMKRGAENEMSVQCLSVFVKAMLVSYKGRNKFGIIHYRFNNTNAKMIFVCDTNITLTLDDRL